MKKFFLLLVFLIISSNALSGSKFDKDLKKVSKDSGFIDDKGKVYANDQISDKKNSILIIYNHGAANDQKIDKCLSPWNKVPPVIRNLHDKKIKNFNIKIYRLCSGVRGWTNKEQTKMWKAHVKSGNLDLSLTDKDGNKIIEKQKQNRKKKIIEKKVKEFKDSGFKNIVLTGHSSGGWQSIKLKAEFPKLVKGVIGLHPGAGGTVRNRKEWPWWTDVRNYGFVEDLSGLDALIIAHDKDHFNSPKDYSIFLNLNSVKFINITDSGCKKKKTLGDYHGIALTKCYANYEKQNKEITKYLEDLFN